MLSDKTGLHLIKRPIFHSRYWKASFYAPPPLHTRKRFSYIRQTKWFDGWLASFHLKRKTIRPTMENLNNMQWLLTEQKKKKQRPRLSRSSSFWSGIIYYSFLTVGENGNNLGNGPFVFTYALWARFHLRWLWPRKSCRNYGVRKAPPVLILLFFSLHIANFNLKV